MNPPDSSLKDGDTAASREMTPPDAVTSPDADHHHTSGADPAIGDEGPESIVIAPPSAALTYRTLAPATVVTLIAMAIILVGLVISSGWLVLSGALVAIAISLRLMAPLGQQILAEISLEQQALLVAIPGALLGIVGLMQISGVNRAIFNWGGTLRWDVIGALGDFLGAFGQIFIAVLAVYVAWRQYVISRDLTAQQNRITQQQTIDTFFQGISDLVLDEEGLLEDWPQERMIAEARTAVILSSVDAPGKAKVIRFLSLSKLLTPLRRDERLGRPILDGRGGYEEDRASGTRVIDLGAMLAACNLASSDLRWTELSEANLVRTDLSRCDLVRANLARAILYQAKLCGADLMAARLFYGAVETATPRTKGDRPDYLSGAFTGAVVEGADFTGVQRLSEQQRRYCCAWGGSATRGTIPGGCDDVPNRLGR